MDARFWGDLTLRCGPRFVVLVMAVRVVSILVRRCYTYITPFQLAQFVLEAAFPSCGLYQRLDSQERGNNWQLKELQDGNTYKKSHCLRLWAGSQEEGVCMEKDWGHGVADRDIMRLYGRELGVRLDRTKDNALLIYRPEGCPPAYCKLEVSDPQMLIEYLKVNSYNSQVAAADCITPENGRHWLHVQNLLRILHGNDVIGPAAQAADGLMDIVPTLVFSGPHPSMESFCARCQGKEWPGSDILDTLRRMPMLHVLVGHKLSPPAESDRHTRTSWSPHEMFIFRNLPHWTKQGYVAFKYTFKDVLKQNEGNITEIEGRSKISSYHLKTTLFYTLEKNPPTNTRQPFVLFRELLRTLQSFLEDGKLPHFFLPECDLLETVSRETRHTALDTVRAILDDPFGAILRSPIEPKEVYGGVKVGHLLELTKLSPRKLDSLVRRLDMYRTKHYNALVEKDRRKGVSGRPKLIRLADLLEHELNED